MTSTFAVEIVIKDAVYHAEPIPAGEFGVAAVRLTKRSVKGEVYDVVLTHDGRAECDCPSYEFTHRGTASTCKHGKACLAKGLLIAPVSGGSPVADVPPAVHAPAPKSAVPPVTAADLKRARFFGLTIPAPRPTPLPAVTIEPGLVPVWEPELAADFESAGPIPAEVDHWSVLALQVA
jgi:hypothetical protein